MTTHTACEPAYGAQMASYFRLPQAPSLVIQPATKPPIAITRLVSDVGLPERTESIPTEKAFVVRHSCYITLDWVVGVSCGCAFVVGRPGEVGQEGGREAVW